MYHTLSKLREKRAKGDQGFTLIELLVVVVILGVLIAIAIPLYLNYRKGANDSAAQSDLKNAINTLEQCNSSTPGYPASMAAVVAPAIGAPCTGQTINLSSGTTLNYLFTGTAPNTGYIITDINTSGSGKVYCYNSTVGGSVKAVTGSITTTVITGSC